MIGEEKGSVAISGRSSDKMTGLKVLFSNEVSWVVIMASQLYCGLRMGDFLTFIVLCPPLGGRI